jgi:WD40 repeat protein
VGWETVHVFVSSTFNDMHGERDYLVKEVFPELRDWCEERKLRLVDIDLRWGVTETDATRNKNVVQVCLDRIDKARPFFICFLGQRYGWVPKDKEIAKKTFEDFAGLNEAVADSSSVTEMEVLHALLRKPFDKAAGMRLPMDHAFFYMRTPAYLAKLPKDLTPLRRTYADAAEPALERRRWLLRKRKHLRMRVRQENGRPVRWYGGHWNPEARTPELALPLMCPSAQAENRERWQQQWKDWAGVATTKEAVVPADEAKARDFNQRLCAGRLEDFWSGDRSLGEVILDDLKAAILARYPERAELPEQDNLEKEIDRHEDFIRTANDVFIEREGDFAALDTYAAGDLRKLFVLVAKAGLGKSTLLAKWVERWRSRDGRPAGETVHARFVGVGERSNTVDTLLRSILEELRRAKSMASEIPDNANVLRSKFAELLGECGKKGQIVVVIDALNQLHSGLADLDWLVRSLPENVKLVVSFKIGDEQGDVLAAQMRANERVTVSEVQPFASLEHRRRLVAAYLRQYLKELDEQHLDALIRADGADNPLFLKVVLTELRVFGSFARLGEMIKNEFGTTPQSAFEAVLRRLENDPSYTPVPSKQAVPLLFGLLAHSRGGLPEDLLVRMLLDEFRRGADSSDDMRATIRPILRQIRPFLAQRHRRTDFYYEAFRLAARTRYAIGKDDSSHWHSRLARAGTKWPCLGQAAKRYALANLIHHQVEAGDGNSAAEAMTSFPYHHERLAALGREDVVNVTTDFEMVHQSALLEPEMRKAFNVWKTFYSQSAHLLQRDVPGLAPETYLLQLSVAHAEMSSVTKSAEAWLVGTGSKRPWLWSLRSPREIQATACLRTLEGHAGWVNDIAVLPDGRQAISASQDGTLKLWDMDNGKCLRSFVGHTDSVEAVSLLPGGERFLSGGYDKTLRIWNIQTGACIRTIEGLTSSVYSVAPLPDGRRVLSKGVNERLQLWDLDTGRCLRTFGRETASTMCAISVLPDGRRALSVAEYQTMLWDIDSGSLLKTLQHPNHVWSIASLPDGQHALSGDYDNTLKLWNLETGKCLRVFRAHEPVTKSIAVLRDGARAISGGGQTVKLWDIKTGRCLRVFDHEHVSAVAFLPDCRRAISAGWDMTLKLWDLEAGPPGRLERGHSDKVRALTIQVSDQRTVSAGDDSTLRVWDLHTGQCLHSTNSECGKATVATVLPGGRQVLSVEYEPILGLWDLDTGQRLRAFSGHMYGIGAIVPIPDGRFAYSRDEKELRLWDLAAGKCVRVLTGHKEWCALEATPKRNYSGRIVEGPPDWVAGMALLQDSRYALLGCRDNTIVLWNLETDRCVRTYAGHSSPVVVLAIVKGGRRVLSASRDGDLKIWDLESGRCLRTLEGHTGPVSALTPIPDGQLAVSTSRDRTVRLWDLESGRCLATWQADSEVICCAVGSGYIAAGTASGEVAFLRLMLPGRVALAAVAAARECYCGLSELDTGIDDNAILPPPPPQGFSPPQILPHRNLLESPITLSSQTYVAVDISGAQTSSTLHTNLLEGPIFLSSGEQVVVELSAVQPSADGNSSRSLNSANPSPGIAAARVAIADIAQLLDSGQAAEAIEVLEDLHQATHCEQNALGVCYLRVERVDDAVSTLRPLATERGSLQLRDDVPVNVRANFTTAILLSGDLGRGESLLDRLDDKHPQVKRLKSAYDAWRKGLSWWRRFQLLFGNTAEPLRLPFPPGELVLEADWPSRPAPKGNRRKSK